MEGGRKKERKEERHGGNRLGGGGGMYGDFESCDSTIKLGEFCSFLPLPLFSTRYLLRFDRLILRTTSAPRSKRRGFFEGTSER